MLFLLNANGTHERETLVLNMQISQAVDPSGQLKRFNLNTRTRKILNLLIWRDDEPTDPLTGGHEGKRFLTRLPKSNNLFLDFFIRDLCTLCSAT